MIINNVTIENFRCYYGLNSLSFNSNSKITLIYGDSGFGKSSFLQFFNWMFYGNPDFGNNNDKPLFNLSAFNECTSGQQIRVFGQIDFAHLGVQYCLTKSVTYGYSINPMNAQIVSQEYKLMHVVDHGWKQYAGDVANKINTILPKGLSKYFLLDGEKARDIVLNSRDLKVAIHQLFGLDAYANTILHIGNKNKKNSVLGYYYSQMAAKMTNVVGKLSASELLEKIQGLYENIENLKDARREIKEEIEIKNARRDEIFKILGAVNNRDNLNQLIKANIGLIADNNQKISLYRHQIGTLFYKAYPYLFLSELASSSSTLLRQQNKIFESSCKNIFEHLDKNLLKEILEKNICICGKELDECSKEKITEIINVMPPNSYSYQFGQFVSKAKRSIQASRIQIMKYESFISRITDCENKNTALEIVNREKLEELKRLDEARAIVEELETIEQDLKQLEREKADYDGRIAQMKQVYEVANKSYSDMKKNSTVAEEFFEKINFFEKIKDAIELEKEEKESSVKNTLNACVREIFKKLTTQTELNADKIQFVNDDFSLRTTYLTGGQLAVDEYAYVIGIIKALQECKMENNENPIIIDAPFAFTGNAQSEHIFKTLPEVSKQTILLTLDLNKINNLLSDDSLFDFYIIENDSQEKAVIRRGNIHDIKF